jgi:phosphohistidine phosphatase
MRRLLLLRHAKTERAKPGERDSDRELTPRGRSDASMIGAYMARHGFVPDLALVSPATRAEETWSLIAAAFAEPPRVIKERLLYNAGADRLDGIIREAGDARALLVVGHNPGLHDLAVALIASGDTTARERVNDKLPTSGLVVIDLPFDNWSRLKAKAGRLERFVSPRLLETATD